jgi:hypothetical protein
VLACCQGPGVRGRRDIHEDLQADDILLVHTFHDGPLQADRGRGPSKGHWQISNPMLWHF